MCCTMTADLAQLLGKDSRGLKEFSKTMTGLFMRLGRSPSVKQGVAGLCGA